MEKLKKVESFSDGRRVCSYPSSPEFEFWMVRNPSLPQPNMLTADDLFADGVMLPFQLLHVSSANPVNVGCVTESGSGVTAPAVPESIIGWGLQRWKDIFRKFRRKEITYHKMNKRRERKPRSVGHPSSAELNINIWPFSRSKSGGNGGKRPKIATGARKINSAPCSRSNSGADSTTRNYPTSLTRPGIYVGKSSPVWHIHLEDSCKMSRPSSTMTDRKCKGKVLRGCEQGGGGQGSGAIGRTGCINNESGVANLLNLRSCFT